jgi:hypothetical protein
MRLVYTTAHQRGDISSEPESSDRPSVHRVMLRYNLFNSQLQQILTQDMISALLGLPRSRTSSIASSSAQTTSTSIVFTSPTPCLRPKGFGSRPHYSNREPVPFSEDPFSSHSPASLIPPVFSSPFSAIYNPFSSDSGFEITAVNYAVHAGAALMGLSSTWVFPLTVTVGRYRRLLLSVYQKYRQCFSSEFCFASHRSSSLT